MKCARPEAAKEHFDRKLSTRDRDNLRRDKNKSACPGCKNEDYTQGGVKTYICHGDKCEFKGRVRQFSEESIARYKKAGRKEEILRVKCAKPKKVQDSVTSSTKRQ